MLLDPVVDDVTDKPFNDIARLREPAHRRHYLEEQLDDLVAQAGLQVTARGRLRRIIDLDYWLQAAAVPAAKAGLIRGRVSTQKPADFRKSAVSGSTGPNLVSTRAVAGRVWASVPGKRSAPPAAVSGSASADRCRRCSYRSRERSTAVTRPCWVTKTGAPEATALPMTPAASRRKSVMVTMSGAGSKSASRADRQ